MAESYRETAARCPSCNQDMDLRDVGGASIDVCQACGGIWIDWFDGDLQEMVKAARNTRLGGGDAEVGSRACPRCQRALAWERFGQGDAGILRCAECAGAFVPCASISTIVEEKRREPQLRAEVSPFARLMAVLRQLVSGSAAADD